MSKLSTLKKTTRAAVAAVIISASAVSAMPAQAANNNNLSFGFSFHSGNGVQFSIGSNGNQHQLVKKRRNLRHCMNKRQVRRGLRDYGFRQIHLWRKNKRKFHVEAVRGRWDYEMVVNRCNGQVSKIKKQRRHRRNHNNGGFNFQFHIR